jgi:hypothetical protein
MYDRGYAESREQAMADFKTAWQPVCGRAANIREAAGREYGAATYGRLFLFAE